MMNSDEEEKNREEDEDENRNIQRRKRVPKKVSFKYGQFYLHNCIYRFASHFTTF